MQTKNSYRIKAINSLKYKDVVGRVLELFNMTVNPIGLSTLENCLDVVDKYKKEHPSLF